MHHSRPKTIDEVASQAEVTSVLKTCLQSNNLPHLLFYGPPGTGKTSTILALARDLFGPTLYRSRLLELNASDERGIDVIRDKVKTFARITASHERVAGYPCPPFKLIILDEADLLTSDAQTALRRIMERYARTTRFCIICNYVSRIIEPLTSRCAKFRFRPIDETAGMARLQTIVEAEGIQLESSPNDPQGEIVLKMLLRSSEGDLRRAITLLQSVHLYLGPKVGVAQIEELAGKIPPGIVQDALNLCKTATKMNNIRDLLGWVEQNIVDEAYAAGLFLQQLLQFIIDDPTISTERKALISMRAAYRDYALTEGANEYLQLVHFLSQCQAILSHPSGTLLHVSAF